MKGKLFIAAGLVGVAIFTGTQILDQNGEDAGADNGVEVEQGDERSTSSWTKKLTALRDESPEMPASETPLREVAEDRVSKNKESVHEKHFPDLTPENAPEILAQLQENPEVWKKSQVQFFRAWGEVDPAGAIQAAIEFDDNEAMMLISLVAEGWAKTDLPAAQEWVQEFREGRDQAMMAHSVLRAMADTDFSERAEWLANMKDGRHSADLVANFSRVWASENPEEAMTWLSGIHLHKVKETSIRKVIADWEKSDSGRVGEYLKSMENGLARDYAVAGYIEAIKANDEGRAQTLAQSIDNVSVRNRTLRSLNAE